MQLAAFRKISLVVLSFGLLLPFAKIEATGNETASTINVNQISSNNDAIKNFGDIKWTPTGIITAFGILSALYLYANLQMKKTQPKRIYPKDDSFEELFKYIHDEILIGQKYLPERLSGEHLDPENPEHIIYEYNKVEARGVAGITEIYLQKTIVPTILLAVAFNTLKWNVKANWLEILNWINSPWNVVGHVPTEKPK